MDLPVKYAKNYATLASKYQKNRGCNFGGGGPAGFAGVVAAGLLAVATGAFGRGGGAGGSGAFG